MLHYSHHVAVAEELSYHLEARSHGPWYLLGRCLAASSSWHFLSPWHAICGERTDIRCYPEVKTAAVGLQGLRECVMRGMCGQGSVYARVSSPDGFCDVGGGLPVWLLLASPAEMLNVSFHTTTAIKKTVQAPSLLLLTEVSKLLSIGYSVEVRDKAQQEFVGGANTKKQATVSLFVRGVQRVRATQMSHCVELVFSFSQVVLQSRLDLYTTLVDALDPLS